MRIAAAVILYCPTDAAIANIESFYNYVEKIFVFDNTEGESKVKERLVQLEKVEYYHNLQNYGIAKPLNEACYKAIEEGFEWILTMDQDSLFAGNAIHTYFSCFRQFTGKESVSLFGIHNHREMKATTADCIVKQADDIITSGTLLNLSAFKEIGPFDEALFIDSVDREYSLRSRLNGYSIIQFSNIYFMHEIGWQVFASSVKSLFLIKKRKEIHSPLRCYYMYRNILYLEKKYKNSNPAYIKKIKKDVTAHIKRSLLYGGSMKTYLKYLIMAKSDFRKNKMGRKELKPKVVFGDESKVPLLSP